MEWFYSGTFTVYSVGDGLFMKRVLDAVAALSNSGVLASLGALGLMVGLILISMRGAASGGKQFELGSLFISFILYVIMFAGKADVIIHDVGLSPGEINENTYTVDNIPFGVAFLGSAISTIGVELTERMEQAYGMPNEVQSIRSVGFGRSLDWLAAVRFAKTTDTNSTNASFQRYRRNLVNYMRYCSAHAIASDPQRVPRMLSSADPLSTTNGFGYASDWVTTSYLPMGGGPASDLTCNQALTNLQAYKSTDQAFTDWANAVAGPMGYSGTGSAVDQARDAFNTVNVAANDAQDYMLAAVTNAAWRDALSDMPIIGSEQIMHTIMTVQQAEQSATQFAGEETMFRRIMRPLMAFLESMVFAVAPFMALAVGLGRYGLGMIAKYCIITTWVALWMPTLSMINMFQITMADRAIATVLGPPGGASAYAIGSMAGAARVEDVVIDWIGTGAMLAASTPMITLVLLFGTAMPLVGLANAFKGGDTLNEKQTSPDAVSSSPAMNHAAGYSYTRAGGTTETGASMPQIEVGRTAQIAQESAATSMASSASRMESKFGQEMANAIQHDISRGVGATSRGEMRLSQTEARATDAVAEKVAGFEQVGSSAQRMVMGMASANELGAGIDPGGLAKGFSKALSGMVEKLGAEKGGQAIEQMAKGLKLGIGGSYTSQDSIDRVSEGLAKMTEQVRSQMRSSDSLKAEVLGASSDTVEQFGRQTGTASQRVTGTTGFASMREDLQQKQQGYREAQSASESAGMRQSIPLNEAAHSLVKSGAAPAAEQAAMQLGSPQAFADAVKHVEASGKFGSMAQNGQEIRAAAAALVLSDSVPGGPEMSESMRGDRAQALMGFLTQSGAINTSAGSRVMSNPGGAEQYSNIANDVQPGRASADVQSANIGAAPGTEAAARGAFNMLGTPDGQAAAASNAATVAGVNEGAVAGRVAAAEGNVASDGTTTFNSQRDAAQPLESLNTGQAASVRMQGRINVDPAAGYQEHNNSAVDPAGEGVTGFNMGKGLARAVGNDSDSSPAAEPAAKFEDLKDNAAAGAYTGGRPVSGPAATVLAGMASENLGERLSADQRQEVRDAYQSLGLDKQNALANINSKWEYGLSHPNMVPQGSAIELSRGSRDGEDQPLLEGQLDGMNYRQMQNGDWMAGGGDAARPAGDPTKYESTRIYRSDDSAAPAMPSPPGESER